MRKARETISARLDEALTELEAAAAHCRTAGNHFGDNEVPRACAHVLAARGHLHAATAQLDELALVHARHSSP